MPEAQATSPPAVRSSPLSGKQAVPLVAATARQLLQPCFWIAVGSLAAGALFWGVCFAPFLLESVRAAFVCLLVLALTASPGAALMWLSRCIRQLSTLPVASEPAPALPPDAPAVPANAPRLAQQTWQQILPFLALRTHLLAAEDELLAIPGLRRTSSILVHPATAVAVPAAASLSVLLAAGACLAIVVEVCRAIF
jgi:hypothetical protein